LEKDKDIKDLKDIKDDKQKENGAAGRP